MGPRRKTRVIPQAERSPTPLMPPYDADPNTWTYRTNRRPKKERPLGKPTFRSLFSKDWDARSRLGEALGAAVRACGEGTNGPARVRMFLVLHREATSILGYLSRALLREPMHAIALDRFGALLKIRKIKEVQLQVVEAKRSTVGSLAVEATTECGITFRQHVLPVKGESYADTARERLARFGAMLKGQYGVTIAEPRRRATTGGSTRRHSRRLTPSPA